MEKMSGKELVKRYIMLVISLFIAALGVAFTKKGGLGVPPTSSAANVMSMRFEAVSLGTWLIVMNCLFIAGQIAILKKNFKLIQLLQLPLSFLFGWFTDIGVLIVEPIKADTYFMRLLMVIIGTVVLGFGITLSVIANVIMNSGEAFVKALSDAIHKEFGYVKIGADIGCVLLAVALSLIFFNFKIVGVREGTLIAAIFTGLVVKFFTMLIGKPLTKLVSE